MSDKKYVIIFRNKTDWEFQIGSETDNEKEAISACIKWRHIFIDRDYGYIDINELIKYVQ